MKVNVRYQQLKHIVPNETNNITGAAGAGERRMKTAEMTTTQFKRSAGTAAILAAICGRDARGPLGLLVAPPPPARDNCPLIVHLR